MAPSTPAPTLSIQLPTYAATAPDSWDPVLDLARTADEVGIDRLFVSDHVVFGEELEAYADPSQGGTVGGRQPTGPDGHWLDPLTVLSVLAGTTQRVRLGTAILLAALRTPAALAKQLATLDVLSGGRIDLGVGVGWQRAEYEASGLPFARRGDLLDHTLDVCRRLWTDQVVAVHDEFLDVDRIHAMPKPVQPGGVPIWVSGRINDRTVRRVVRFGSGWIPWGDHIADPAPGIATLRAALEEAGRADEDLRVQGSLVVRRDGDRVDLGTTFAGLPALLAAGVTDVKLVHRWLGDPHDAAAAAGLLAEAVERFAEAAGR